MLLSGLISFEFIFFQFSPILTFFSKKVDVVEIQKQRLEELNSLVFENEVEKRKFWVKMTDSFSACLGFNREVVHRIWVS